MVTDEINELSIIDDLQENVLPKLKGIWGFHPWFIVRVQVFYFLFLIRIGTFKSKTEPFSTRITFKEIIKFIKLLLHKTRWKISNRNKYSENVLIVGYRRHRYDISKEKINLYVDPFRSYAEQLGVEPLLFFLDGVDDSDAQAKSLFRYYKFEVFLNRIILKFKMRFTQSGRSEFKKIKENRDVIYAWLKGKGVEQAEQISFIVMNAMIKNEVVFRAFNSLFKIKKFNLVWSYCFYDNDTSAVLRAAKNNNIRFVDYQHSQQSESHFVYSQWNNADMASPFFPSTFWVWRREEKERIIRNFTGSIYKPEVVHGGNLYLSLIKSESSQNVPKNSILVSLQGQWIPEFLEDFVKTDTNFTWYFRTHPRYEGDKEKLRQFKEQYGKTVKFQDANESSLYDVFANVSFNITSYSGVAIEANEFGIKNIIYGDKGYVTFREYIEKGVFAFAFDQATLKEALSNSTIIGQSESVIMSNESIKNNLRLLLSDYDLK